jgi:Flp pilus assembly protein TadD
VYRPALEDFTRALELEPDDAIAHYNLAIVLAALGQSTTANESFRKSCEFGLEQGCLKMKSSVP